MIALNKQQSMSKLFGLFCRSEIVTTVAPQARRMGAHCSVGPFPITRAIVFREESELKAIRGNVSQVKFHLPYYQIWVALFLLRSQDGSSASRLMHAEEQSILSIDRGRWVTCTECTTHCRRL